MNGRGCVPLILLDIGEPEGIVDRGAVPVSTLGEPVPFDRGYGVEVIMGPDEGLSGPVVLLVPLADALPPVVAVVALLLENVNGVGAVPLEECDRCGEPVAATEELPSVLRVTPEVKTPDDADAVTGAEAPGPVLKPGELGVADNVRLESGKGTEGETELDAVGGVMLPLPEAVAGGRLDERLLAREEPTVVGTELDGLGGILNGCGAPGTEAVDDDVALLPEVAP